MLVLVPADTYDVWVVYDEGDAWVVREGLEVTGTTRLTLSPADAIHTATLDPTDKDGRAIPSSATYVGQYMEHVPSGIYYRVRGMIYKGHQVYLSEVSSDYDWQWRIDAAWNQDWYELNGALTGISGDVTFENDPSSFHHILYEYHPVPSRSRLRFEWSTHTRPYG